MEGVSNEAASIAGTLGLGKLVYFYDDNHITIDGTTTISFTEDRNARFVAQGWHVQQVDDANDLGALREAIAAAQDETERPSMIVVRSHIGYGAPHAVDTAGAHGAPLGEDEVRATKERFGWDPDKHFFVPEGVYERFGTIERGAIAQREWEHRFRAWQDANSELAKEWDAAWAGRPLPGLGAALPTYAAGKQVATRSAGGEALQAIAPYLPTMVGGSADLNESVKTGIKGEPAYSREHSARNVYWGIREHAMGSAVNGMVLHGGIVKPYGATFLQFADYMRPALRLSALMNVPVVWVYTHDSVALGEDGPTHQPVEHLAALRAIPGLTVIRPSDANETAVAWRVVVEELDGPAVLVLTRQSLPVLDRSTFAPAEELVRGAYVLAEDDAAVATIVGTGSEVSLALAARDLLAGEAIAVRVVAMPSWELFAAQDDAYRASVLPPDQPKVSVEAGIAMGWAQFVDASVSIERFGASAPGEVVMRELGMTPEHVADAVRELL
jgi:transketolase